MSSRIHIRDEWISPDGRIYISYLRSYL